jgi:proline iminopeptidase
MLRVPSLLILGEFDPVICEKHVQEYDKVKLGEKVMFQGVGHTPHTEDPVQFSEVVTNFVIRKI